MPSLARHAGIRLGVTTVNGRGAILTSPGPGAEPQVKLFDGVAFDHLQQFFAFDPFFSGGVFVVG